MDLQVLVSTMNQDNHSLLSKMNIQSDAIVINQSDTDNIAYMDHGVFKTKWINSNRRGLSCSRNMAINNANAMICILADDDLEYVGGYKDIILKQFELYPDVDIITFQVEGIERKFKNYHKKTRKANYLTSMKVSSVEIAFRLNSIKETGIQFNEMFGSGAKYFAGEENIFLIECLRKGLNIKYVPIKIADLHIGESTWFKGYNRDYFITKGAGFTAISKFFSIPLILQFAFRKHKLYSKEMSIMNAVKLMLQGRKEFIKRISL